MRYDRDLLAGLLNESNDVMRAIVGDAGCNVDVSTLHDPFCGESVQCPCIGQYKNYKEATDILLQIINRDITNIVVKVDPDVDGYTSAAIFASFINAEFANEVGATEIRYIFASGKQHGFSVEECEEALGTGWDDNVDLIVIPDAGCDPQSLHNAEVFIEKHPSAKVLIVDHHPYNERDVSQSDRVVVVNAHSGINGQNNIHMTGAGMMWMLMGRENFPGVALGHPAYMHHISKLCALGMIADVTDLRDIQARKVVYEGLQWMEWELNNELTTNPSLTIALYNANRYNIKHGITIATVGWYIAPPINAVIRFGTQEDKRDMFDALVWRPNDTRTVEYTPASGKNKGKTQIISYQDDIARRAKNAKSRQDTAVRKMMQDYLGQISQEEIDDSAMVVLLRDFVDDKNKSLTGLVANKLTKEVQRPVLLLTKDGDTYSGSGRGYEASGISSFKEALQKVHDELNIEPLVLGGHDNAFGFGVTEDDLDRIIDTMNRLYAPDNLKPGIPVEYEVDGKNSLLSKLVSLLSQYYALWGNHLEEPRLAITNVTVKPSDIHEFQNGQMISFQCNGVQYTKKYCNKNEYDNLIGLCTRNSLGTQGKTLVFTIIGTCDCYKDKSGVEQSYVKVSKWSAKVKEDDEIVF